MSEPVPFMCAGAKFTGHDNRVDGRFHPLSHEFWNAIIGFHRQVSINHDAESVSYHKWHEPTGQYHTIIPWQQTSTHGLSVHTEWTDPRNVALLDEYARRFGAEFFPACTIHTHVDISGFESGTDANDEKDNAGWHITLGKLVSFKRYDLHFRMRAPKRKAVSKVINTELAIPLKWQHLFAKGDGVEEFVHTTPGTTDFHQFLDRVEAV